MNEIACAGWKQARKTRSDDVNDNLGKSRATDFHACGTEIWSGVGCTCNKKHTMEEDLCCTH